MKVEAGSYDNENSIDKRKNVAESLEQRMFVLHELITSEEKYVLDLASVVNGYIRPINDLESDIPIPKKLKDDKWRMVFGNLEAIYEWHRE